MSDTTTPETPVSATVPEATPKRGPGAPRGRRPKRLRRVKRVVGDVRRVGVGATEAATPGQRAEPVRVDADKAPEITRMSLEDRQITTFDLPPHRKKPGRDYKWEVVTIMGQRVDRAVMRDAHRAGWRPELAKDWPELAEGLSPNDPVEEGGQILMGRPIHLSHEAQVEAYNRAKTQERERMQAAAGGQLSSGGGEPLSQVRGIQVRNASLEVQLAVGGGPLGR